MHGASAKLSKTAAELLAELDWAAQVLTGDCSASRIQFALPIASAPCHDVHYNWDVQVSCRPDQDAAAQAAIQHVADKWRLAVCAADTFFHLAAAYRSGCDAAISTPAGDNPFAPHDQAMHRAWALGRAQRGS